MDWNDFFARYRALALRFARGLAGERAPLEDLVQEAAKAVLEKAAREAQPFQSPAHARNYFFRALHHLALDARHASRRAAKSLDEESGEPASRDPSPAETAASAERAKMQAGRIGELTRALDRLDPDQGELLRLRFAEGLTFQEISQRTGISISTLHARVESAFGKIRKRIGKIGAEGE